MESGEDCQYEDHIQRQRHIGDDARNTVVEDHEGDHSDQTDQACDLALLDRIMTQRGADRSIFDDLDLRWQCARSQDDGQIFGLFLRARSGNDRTTVHDLGLNDGCGVDGPVEDDGQTVLDMGSRDSPEETHTLIGGSQIDDRLAHVFDTLADGNLSVSDHVPRHLGFRARQIQDIVPIALGPLGFAREEEFHVIGNHALCALIGEHRLYGCHVPLHHSNFATQAHQTRQQASRIVLRCGDLVCIVEQTRLALSTFFTEQTGCDGGRIGGSVLCGRLLGVIDGIDLSRCRVTIKPRGQHRIDSL